MRDGFDEEEEAETTVQIIFFDGEEAFHDWTDTDSIYGARYLAEEWSETYLPPAHPLTRRRMHPHPTVLSTIDHLVLFDLLGNKHSSIRSFFRETDWLFDRMASGDERLREARLIEVEKGEDTWFRTEKGRKGMVGDDHIPVSKNKLEKSTRIWLNCGLFSFWTEALAYYTSFQRLFLVYGIPSL